MLRCSCAIFLRTIIYKRLFSRPSNNSKRRRRNMSEDSQNSNKSLRVQFDTNSEERREDRRNERRGEDEVDGQGRRSDRQKRSSEGFDRQRRSAVGFDREARISERYDQKVGESDRRIIHQDYRELQVKLASSFLVIKRSSKTEAL